MSTTGCCRGLSARDCAARPYGCHDGPSRDGDERPSDEHLLNRYEENVETYLDAVLGEPLPSVPEAVRDEIEALTYDADKSHQEKLRLQAEVARLTQERDEAKREPIIPVSLRCTKCGGFGTDGYEYVENIAVGHSPCQECEGTGIASDGRSFPSLTPDEIKYAVEAGWISQDAIEVADTIASLRAELAEVAAKHGHMTANAMREQARAETAEAQLAEVRAALERASVGVCEGCGTSRTKAEIDAGGYRSCCPERKMLSAKQWAERAEKAEAELAEARAALEPFAEIYGALESLRELDRSAQIRHVFVHADGGGASGCLGGLGHDDFHRAVLARTQDTQKDPAEAGPEVTCGREAAKTAGV